MCYYGMQQQEWEQKIWKQEGDINLKLFYATDLML